MIVLEIKDKEFELCSDWSEISLGQYTDVLAIWQDKWTDLDKTIRIIASISSNPTELLDILYNQMDMNDIKEISREIKWMDEDFKKSAKQLRDKNILEVDGIKYTIKSDYNKLTNNEMIWCEEQLKNPNLHAFEIGLAVLLRRIDENGNAQGFNTDFATEILTTIKYKIKILECYNYLDFFLRTGKKSSKKISKGFSIRKK